MWIPPLKPRQASQQDADLERSRHGLNLYRAAGLGDWLAASLAMAAHDPMDHGLLQDHPTRTLRQLLLDVRQMLQQAFHCAIPRSRPRKHPP